MNWSSAHVYTMRYWECQYMMLRCDFLTLVSHFLLVFNSSSNIAIYCWKDEKFRKV